MLIDMVFYATFARFARHEKRVLDRKWELLEVKEIRRIALNCGHYHKHKGDLVPTEVLMRSFVARPDQFLQVCGLIAFASSLYNS